MRRAILTALATLTLLPSAAVPKSLEDDRADLGTMIDRLFVAYTIGDQPGYAIGVVNQGKLTFAGGYGMADIESKTPIGPATAFNLASLSKQFTAAAIAHQIVHEEMSLDDTLASHWEGLPEAFAKVEIGHLVYMTSGLPEYYTLPSPKGGWASEDAFTVDDAISTVLATERLEYEPGSRWSYSNINYQLLAEVFADQRKSSFADAMAAAFFTPMGLERTWVDAPIDKSRDYRATSYNWSDEADRWIVSPRMSPHYGGSGIFSTLTDLAKWDAALYTDKAFGEPFSAQMLATRTYDHDKTNDAFGLVHSSYRGEDTVWYEGGDYGVSTYMVRLPGRDQSVICLSNIGNGGCASKARAVLDILLNFDRDADFVRDPDQ